MSEVQVWGQVVRPFDVKEELVLFASDRSDFRVNVCNMGPSAGPSNTRNHPAEWKEDPGFNKM